jgi:spore germination protein YaaH
MKYIVLLIAVFSIVSLTPLTALAETQAYYFDNGEGDESFSHNYRNIDVISPQIYYVGSDFDLHETDDHGVIRKAKREDVKIVPLVFQQGFNRQLMSELLTDKDLQEQVIDDLIDKADDEDYAGWQFDFENIASTDRAAYTSFVKDAAKEFARKDLELSVAVVPRTTPYNPAISYQDLTEAYDYAKLAEYADYIVAMAYNDPNSFGPTGSLMYQEAVVQYLITEVPADKLQLGVPLYCSKWGLAGGYHKFGTLSHSDTEEDIDDSKLLVRGYLNGLESEYSAYIVPSGNVYLTWCDGPEGFAAKQKLAEKYHLRGISMWALGQEDKDIWDHL